MTEVDAFLAWWASDSEPAEKHWSLPCALNNNVPYQCNPSCGQHIDGRYDGCDPDNLLCQ